MQLSDDAITDAELRQHEDAFREANFRVLDLEAELRLASQVLESRRLALSDAYYRSRHR